jgi:hypothetical protein
MKKKFFKSLELICDGIDRYIGETPSFVDEYKEELKACREELNALKVTEKSDDATKLCSSIVERVHQLLEKIESARNRGHAINVSLLDAECFDVYMEWIKEWRNISHPFDEDKAALIVAFHKILKEHERKRTIIFGAERFLKLISDFSHKGFISQKLILESAWTDIHRVGFLVENFSLFEEKFKNLSVVFQPYFQEEAGSKDSPDKASFFRLFNEFFDLIDIMETPISSNLKWNVWVFYAIGEEASRFSDRQAEFKACVEDFFSLSDECVHHSGWSTKTRKPGVPDGIQGLRKVLKARSDYFNRGYWSQAKQKDCFLEPLKDFEQINSERLSLSLNSRHPITQQFYDQHLKLTQALIKLIGEDNHYKECKTWVSKEDLKKANKIVERMKSLKNKIVVFLENQKANSLNMAAQCSQKVSTNSNEETQIFNINSFLIFKDIDNFLKNTKALSASSEWDTKGIHVFFISSKPPTGIKAIRTLLEDFEGSNAQNPVDKIALLKKFRGIGQVLAERHSGINLCRHKDTKAAYEKLLTDYNSLFDRLFNNKCVIDFSVAQEGDKGLISGREERRVRFVEEPEVRVFNP